MRLEAAEEHEALDEAIADRDVPRVEEPVMNRLETSRAAARRKNARE
ncbi:hypothetical protein ACFYYY_20265 [Streptomyces sp. NPDC001834]